MNQYVDKEVKKFKVVDLIPGVVAFCFIFMILFWYMIIQGDTGEGVLFFLLPTFGLAIGLGFIMVGLGNSISVDPDLERRKKRKSAFRKIVWAIFFAGILLFSHITLISVRKTIKDQDYVKTQRQIITNTEALARTNPSNVKECKVLHKVGHNEEWKDCVHKVFSSTVSRDDQLQSCLADDFTIFDTPYPALNITEKQFCFSEAITPCLENTDLKTEDACLWSTFSKKLADIKKGSGTAINICDSFHAEKYKLACLVNADAKSDDELYSACVSWPYSNKNDADGDSLNDYEEIFVTGTGPCQSDTDGDGYSDKLEIESGNDPFGSSGRPAPIISNITIRPRNNQAFIVDWHVTQIASCKFLYGVTPGKLENKLERGGSGRSCSLEVPAVNGITYYYKIYSCTFGAQSKCAESEEKTYTFSMSTLNEGAAQTSTSQNIVGNEPDTL